MKKNLLKLVAAIAALSITAMSLPMSVGAMATKGENLISNPGFESGTSSWTKKGTCTLSEETTEIKYDTKSIKITGRSESNAGVSQKVTFDENSTYIMSVWVKPVSAAVTARMRVGTQINPASISCSVGNWTQFKYTLDTTTLRTLILYIALLSILTKRKSCRSW
ncbi:MAG: carbohydrate binding domain-containing protein [Clostridia bacterium]|nr:carbohydrate binding domain-containing protein [Clostridia bacterium]